MIINIFKFLITVNKRPDLVFIVIQIQIFYLKIKNKVLAEYLYFLRKIFFLQEQFFSFFHSSIYFIKSIDLKIDAINIASELVCNNP